MHRLEPVKLAGMASIAIAFDETTLNSQEQG
jgi:hypothetical protein